MYIPTTMVTTMHLFFIIHNTHMYMYSQFTGVVVGGTTLLRDKELANELLVTRESIKKRLVLCIPHRNTM